jgi:hypothetical protein
MDKDTKGALEAAIMLVKEDPSDSNKEMVAFLQDINNLNEACRDTHKLLKYLEDIDDKKAINDVLHALPDAITAQPFAIHYFQKYSLPKTWGSKTICYYANFGGKHFEKWDGNSLKDGIGGSETAVIRLAEEWAKRGYEVIVYGDPEKECVINDVLYTPWYKFNPRDRFNIFIQWRNSSYSRRIKANKFLVDLHDIYHQTDLESHIDAVDKVMVKSEYHRGLAPDIPSSKFKVVSNGI